MGHHQVLFVTHHLLLNYNATFFYLHLHIEVIIGLSRSSFRPLGMSLNDKVDIGFILLYLT
jgi:hypothetical protein